MVAAASFEPHAVSQHAFFKLPAEAVGGVVDGGRDQILVTEQKADESDGAVMSALDIMNAQTARKNDLLESGAQKLRGDRLAIRIGERCPDQVHALGNPD